MFPASSRPNPTRRSVLKTASGALAATLLAPAAARAQSPAPRVLTYSDHEPLGGMRTTFLKEVLFPAIARESEGRLKIEDHWDGAIAGAYDALGAAGRSAAADMATVVPEYTAEDLPLHQIFKSFPMGPTGARQVAFFRRAYEEIPELGAELARNDVVNLFCGTGYPVAFFSAQPMADLTGVVGRKWRTASFWHYDFLAAAGAEPVRIPWGPQVYEALRMGALDGLMVNVDSGHMLNVYEVAPHVLAAKDLWLGHVYLLAMKRSVWETLAPEDRAAIQRAAEFAYGGLGAVMDASFAAQLEVLAAAGASLREIAPEEARAWRDMTRYEQAQRKWIDEQAEKGVVAGPVLDRIAALLAESMG